MQDRKQELEKLIDRYLAKQLNAEDKQRMEQWLRELDMSEGNAVDLHRYKAILKQRIDERLLPEPNWVPATKWHSTHWLAVAACLLVFLVAGLQFLQPEQDAPSIAQLAESPASKAITPVWKTLSNSSSADSIIDLEDGTRVRLLANSSLTVKTPFGPSGREVQLAGKAFFDVAHDSSRPFSVLSGNVLTTALGTSFWVEQSYAGAKPRVRLITGRVSIKQRNEHGEEILLAYLDPGQSWQAARSKKAVETTPKPAVGKMDEPVATSLFFHHKPLLEVLPALASFYNTTIVFSAKEVAGMSFYGSYDQQNRIEQILETICIANDLTVDWDEDTNTYTIHRIN